jgi:hypothetical protein
MSPISICCCLKSAEAKRVPPDSRRSSCVDSIRNCDSGETDKGAVRFVCEIGSARDSNCIGQEYQRSLR